MWDTPLYLEYASHERMSELDRVTKRAQARARARVSRPCGLRRSLARGLVCVGLHLDPQAAQPPAHNGRPRLASQ